MEIVHYNSFLGVVLSCFSSRQAYSAVLLSSPGISSVLSLQGALLLAWQSVYVGDRPLYTSLVFFVRMTYHHTNSQTVFSSSAQVRAVPKKGAWPDNS